MNKLLKFLAILVFSVLAVTYLDVLMQLAFAYLAWALIFALEGLLSCFVVARLVAARIRERVESQLNRFLLLFAVLCLPLALCLMTAPHWLAYAVNVAPVKILTEGGELGLIVGFFCALKVLSDDLAREGVLRQARSSIVEARRLMGLEQYQDADEKLREALVASEMQFGSNHEEPARLSEALAELFQESNEPEKAAAMHRRALSIYEQLLGKRAPKVAECIVNIARVEGASDTDPDATIVLLREALSIREGELGAAHPLVGSVVQALSELLARKERWSEAEDYARRALEISRKTAIQATPEPLGVATVSADALALEINQRTGRLALILTHTSRIGEAERLIHEALAEREQRKLSADKDTIWMLLELSRIHTQNGKKVPARERALEALRLLCTEVGPEHPATKEIFEQSIPILTADLPQPDSAELYAGILKADSLSTRRRVDKEPKLLHSADALQWRPLQWAVFLGLDRITDTLVGAGAAVEATDWPPIHIATRWNHRRIVPALLTKGADASSLTADGSTLLHQCALAGDDRLIDTLSNKGAKSNLANRAGLTPLHLAARGGHTRVIVELLAHGAGINDPNTENGWTALHYACAGGHVAIVECLHLNGASAQLQTQSGRTAAALALEHGHPNVAEILKSNSR